MKIISQTNRTLLLEEFNPEKLDLLTMIGDVRGVDSLSDCSATKFLRNSDSENEKK